MDFNRVAWFTSGLLVGSILDTTTTLILIVSWMLVINEPLSEMFGGYLPQQIVRSVLGWIRSKSTKVNSRKIDDAQEPDKQITSIQPNIHQIIMNLQPVPPSSGSLPIIHGRRKNK